MNKDFNALNTTNFVNYKKTPCLRCKDKKEIWVWEDLTESKKVRVDCPMCNRQRPPQELREDGLI